MSIAKKSFLHPCILLYILILSFRSQPNFQRANNMMFTPHCLFSIHCNLVFRSLILWQYGTSNQQLTLSNQSLWAYITPYPTWLQGQLTLLTILSLSHTYLPYLFWCSLFLLRLRSLRLLLLWCSSLSHLYPSLLPLSTSFEQAHSPSRGEWSLKNG